MKKFVAGILFGVFLSGAVSASGVLTFGYWDLLEIRKVDESSRMMYVAGINDAVLTVDWYLQNSKNSYEQDHKKIQEMIRCMRFRGKTLGSLSAYADASWGEAWRKVPSVDAEGTNAAAWLIMTACRD